MSLCPQPDAKIQQRFWSKVIKANTDGCWLWTAHRNKDGYGTFKISPKDYLAHRTAYAISHQLQMKDIEQIQVLHSCDNPPCVNPKHLRPGTPKENADDREARQRHPHDNKGEKSGRAKLKDQDILRIKELRLAGHTHKELAKLFNVHWKHIGEICRGTGRVA